MPAISFNAELTDEDGKTMKQKILSGEKKQTIRPKRSDYWLRWGKGDRLVGYWKMRSSEESKKLFESEFAEDPLMIKPNDWTNSLAYNDGFRPRMIDGQKVSALGAMRYWFKEKYGEEYEDMEFVIIRWK